MRLRAATSKIVIDSDYIARLASMAVEPINITTEQASTFVASEMQKWRIVAATSKIQVD